MLSVLIQRKRSRTFRIAGLVNECKKIKIRGRLLEKILDRLLRFNSGINNPADVKRKPCVRRRVDRPDLIERKNCRTDKAKRLQRRTKLDDILPAQFSAGNYGGFQICRI